MLAFADAEAFGRWLRTHHATQKGLWLKLQRKRPGAPALTYAQALDEALCWGWVDGVKGRYDEAAWLQRFTPRGPRSLWSKVNQAKVAALVAAGRLQPAGVAAVERAKASGQWARAYAPAKTAQPPDDLLAALRAQPKALTFFLTLTGANRYAILHRVQTAKKPETRARRIAQFVALCAEGKTLH